MQDYNSIKEFEYWNVDSWKNYVKHYMLPLYNSILKLLKLKEYFKMYIFDNKSDITISEMLRKSEEMKINRENLLSFILGGVKENGEYKGNSLAKLIHYAIGIFTDTERWSMLEKEIDYAFNYVKVKVEDDNTFLKFLNSLKINIEGILKSIKEELKEVSENEIKEIIQNPNQILEIIKTIYIKCIEISANHNYYTFFILSTEKLPRCLLEKAYPKVKDNFDSLKDFLGLRKYFEPQINENDKKEWTVWTYSKVGRMIYELNDAIWNNFNLNKIEEVWAFVSKEIPNLLEDYEKKAKELVKNYGNFKYIPEYYYKDYKRCKICDEKDPNKNYIDYLDKFVYTIREITIDASHITHYIGGYARYGPKMHHHENISTLMFFFTDIFQMLFFKMINYEIKDNKIELKWKK